MTDGTSVRTGASRSTAPDSASRIVSVAVAIFVIENHGAACSVVIGAPVTMSATPIAQRLRTPSGPTISTATPGTCLPTSFLTRSPRSVLIGQIATWVPSPRASAAS